MKRRLDLDQRTVPLPKGTRVVLLQDVRATDAWVCRKGTVARIEEVAHPEYVVRTPSDHVLRLSRERLTVQNARLQDVAEQRAWSWAQFADHVVLEVVVGSTAWGLTTPESDEDVRGAFLLPHAHRVGLYDPPDELQPAGEEAQYWEVEKLIRQALRADANTLEMLWSPLVRREMSVGRLIREHRRLFVSKRIYGTFGRYAISQFEKMQRKLEQHEVETAILDVLVDAPDLPRHAMIERLGQRGLGDPETVQERLRRVAHAWFDRGLIPTRHVDDLRERMKAPLPERRAFRPKNAYNLLRLLHSGISWMQTGEPLIAIEDPALHARLMGIKRGETPLEDVITEARQLFSTFEEATEASTLPDEPDLDGADRLLRTCRDVAARRHFGLGTSLPPRVEVLAPRPTDIEVDLTLARSWLPDRVGARDVVLIALTGAHDYGFPSPDSDLDLKGIHLAPASAVLGTRRTVPGVDTIQVVDGVELDLTLNEAGEAVRLLTKGNGNMLERLASPFQVWPVPGTSERAQERLDWLRHLGRRSVHRGSLHHYRGFFRQVAGRATKAPTVKGWLYAYRVAITGVHLLCTGDVVADLTRLLDDYDLDHIRPLIAAKIAGAEKGGVDHLPDALQRRVLADLDHLEARLQDAADRSPLPEQCPNEDDLEDWLAYWRIHPVQD
jgi:predicted nucleotidyltransferase